MKGLFKTAAGPGNLEIREAPRPEAGPGQVLIEVKAAGICASDLHIQNWDIAFAMRPPMIIGHEFCGQIAELGAGVEGWQVGDRVTSETTFSTCGTCRYCRSGNINLCPERRVIGYWHDGCFTRYIAVPAQRLHRLPENADFTEGALSEPLACCVHAVLELTGVRTGEIVGVSGPGTIGLLCLQLVKAGGGTVVVFGTEIDGKRLELARELGADEVVVVGSAPKSMADDLDVFFECSGASSAAAMGLELLRKQGRYCQVGLFGAPITIDFEKLAYKEIAAIGSISHRWSSWNTGLSLVAKKRLRLAPMISDVMKLGEWERAFEKMRSKQCAKIILQPED